jgi:hypothetical protein
VTPPPTATAPAPAAVKLAVPNAVASAPIPGASRPSSETPAAPAPVTPPPAAAAPVPAPVKLAVPNVVASAPIPGANRPVSETAAAKPTPVTGQLPLGMPEPAAESPSTSVRQAVASALRTPAPAPAADDKPSDDGTSA